MSVIKSFSVGNADTFYIDHNSDNFSIIDCCLDEDTKDGILGEVSALSARKGITRFISKIAFVAERDGNEEIYVMNADDSGATNVTKNPARDVYATWSPR